MKTFWMVFLVVMCGAYLDGTHRLSAQGITPEQIFQPTLNMNDMIATWEALPEENPLEEKAGPKTEALRRSLLTLRRDGTCRVFDKENPSGSDCIWSLEEHELHIRFPAGVAQEFFVYGVKSEFMVTRSPIKGGRDQLWSKVK